MTNGVKTHWRGGIRMYPIHISLSDLTNHLSIQESVYAHKARGLNRTLDA